jgi:hypothetical protein
VYLGEMCMRQGKRRSRRRGVGRQQNKEGEVGGLEEEGVMSQREMGAVVATAVAVAALLLVGRGRYQALI